MAKQKATDAVKEGTNNNSQWKTKELDDDDKVKLLALFGVEDTKLAVYTDPTDDGDVTRDKKGIIIAMAPSKRGTDG